MEALESLLPDYCKRLKKKGVTRQMLHEEYLSLRPDGYARSRFNVRLFNTTVTVPAPSCILNTKPATRCILILPATSRKL